MSVGGDGQTVTYESESGKTQNFTFNRAFGEYALQEEVYEYAAQPMVEDVLNGFSAAIIAYGQTGAGKTYTMQGPGFDDPKLHELGYDEGMKGIIPRVMEEIFFQVAQAPPHIQIDVCASYLEIYMEKTRDLLAPHRQLEILDQPGGGVIVTGAEVLTMLSSNEIIATMQRGARNRMVASTKSNDESSRGHAIFLITVTKHDAINQLTQKAQLYLVDLAGSEKADKTGAEGLRLDEAKKINQSLLALGNVISALSSGDKRHVPYRNSKLTRLLKNSLGGNARTTLIVNCSPNSVNALETLSTLRFGDRASRIKNKPVVNQHRSVEVLEALLKESERKNEEQARFIQYLQAELERLSNNNNNNSASGSAADHPAGDRGQSQEQAAVMRGGGKGKEKLHDECDGLLYVDADKENRVPNTTTPVGPPPPASYDSAHHQAEGEESARKEQHDERVAQITPLTRRPVIHGNVNHRHRQEMLHYVCPLTRGIFKDPVFCADGHTYERQAIKLYLKGHHRSPLTGQRLDHKKLTPNYHLRKLLAAKRDCDPVFSTVNFFGVLPYELLCLIFSQLDAVSLGRSMMVCRMFEEVLRDDVFWRQMLVRDAPDKEANKNDPRPRERYVKLFLDRRAALRQAKRLTTAAVLPLGHTGALTLFRT